MSFWKQFGKKLNNVKKAGKEVIVDYIFPAGIEANDMIDTYKEVTKKIDSVVEDKEQQEILLKELFEIALESKRGIKSVTDIYTTMAPALNEKGYGNFEQAELSQNLSNLFTFLDTTEADIQKILEALSTTFKKGKMGEEEFKAILYAKKEMIENLAKVMQVDIKGLEDLVKSKKITIEKIFQALENNARYLKAEVDKMPLKSYDDVVDRFITKLMADLNKNLKGKEDFAELSLGIGKTLLNLVLSGLVDPLLYLKLDKITRDFQNKETEIKNKFFEVFEKEFDIKGSYESNLEYKKKFDEKYKALLNDALNKERDNFIEKANSFLETFDKKTKEREEKRDKLFKAKPVNKQDEVE